MIDDSDALDRLARELGVEPEYDDVFGRRHRAPLATKLALLGIMGVPVGDEAALREALATRRRLAWCRPLPPVVVLREPGPWVIPVTLMGEHETRLPWRLELESGEAEEGEVEVAALTVAATRRVDGRECIRYDFVLSKPPPYGYHRFLAANGVTRLIVAPARCHVPPALDAGARVYGLSLQLYAVRSRRNWGMGDFSDLGAFARGAAAHGAAVAGVNPLHALFPHNPAHASPYSPSSRLYLNVLYLDAEAMHGFADCRAAVERAAAPEFQAELSRLRREPEVDYAAVARLKWPLFEMLYAHFRRTDVAADSAAARAFRAFQAREGERLRRHALFEALQAHFHAQDARVWGWPAWPPNYHDPTSPEVDAFARDKRERVEFYAYLQWQADAQLARAADAGLGIGLYRDLAVGVDAGGAEAWANQAFYLRAARVGCPPDEFNLRGQDWGLPPLSPFALYESAYAPFIATLRANMCHAGVLRLDHVMGLMRLFWIPEGAGAEAGTYVHYPFSDLLGILALESRRHRCLIVGEDLGTVPDEVRAALAPLGVLSYRLFYFERSQSGDFLPPAQFPTQALVALTTHDLPTLAGFWSGQDIQERAALGLYPTDTERDRQIVARAEDRARVLVALEREGLRPESVPLDAHAMPEVTPALMQALHRYLARAPSQLLLAQSDDALLQKVGVNLPGTTDERPNWRLKWAAMLEDFFADPGVLGLIEAMARERPPRARATPLAPDVPDCTYRMQLSAGFRFRDCARIVPYLARLGVSHLYCSPYLKARPGSAHGYDVVDHNTLNPEIGDDDELAALNATLKAHGMRQILDIVPNHMGIGADNPWWFDVLEHGQASAYAGYFDIEWYPLKPELHGKVLLPVLSDYYGSVLTRGEIQLAFERERGAFELRYASHRFPVDPKSYRRILSMEIEPAQSDEAPDIVALKSLATAFRNLAARDDPASNRRAERVRDAPLLKRSLAELVARAPAAARAVDASVAFLNGRAGDGATYVELHRLLEEQAYRLAYWRVAGDEINYRRFFEINDLAALRAERAEVFAATHRRVLDLIVHGDISGLRIDHPDGLYAPREYLQRLQAAVRAAREGRAQPERAEPDDNATESSFYVVVEKILAPGERLPDDWPVHGTTGYDFAALVNGLFVYAPAEAEMLRLYTAFTRGKTDFGAVVYESKTRIMLTALAGELNVLARRFERLAERRWDTRDFTYAALRQAILEVAACFPVYRTYVGDGASTPADRAAIEDAVAQARARNRALEIEVFEFVRAVLLREVARDEGLDLVRRFQQFTAPVTAKGVEDTAFYRDARLLSLNEVGDDPRRFGVEVEAFHAANLDAARRFPHRLLAGSTHDSKRSEDVRARIDVLSELHEAWAERVRRWAALNASHKRTLRGRPAPSAHDEYALYQTLVGAWPTGELDAAGLAAFRARVGAFALKAAREAKRDTSWITPNSEYEKALADFVEALLARPDTPFLADFVSFAARVALLGALTSLSQTALKLWSPGAPDLYQGNELLELSLVDPDNRRPVDYAARERLLAALEGLGEAEALPFVRDDPARAKLYLIWRSLEWRRRHRGALHEADYVPLAVAGPAREHVVAFARVHTTVSFVVIAPRWYARLLGAETAWPPASPAWAATRVVWTGPRAQSFHNVLTGERIEPAEEGGEMAIPVSVACAAFPVAVLTSA